MSHDIISTIPTRGRIHGDTHTHPQASTELTCHASIVCIEYLLGREAGSAQKIGKQIARQTNTQINRYRAASVLCCAGENAAGASNIILHPRL